MSTPINEIFNEQAIKAQVAAVLTEVTRVSEALKALKAAVDNTKITKSDVQSAKNAAALEAANTKVAAAIAKRAQEEEKLAILIAKRAAAEANAARATGQSNSAMTEIERLTKLYEETLKRLNGTYSQEARNLANVKVLHSERTKELKQQAREVLGLSGAYDKLQAEYTEAKVKAQNLGVTMGVTSQEYIEASAAALQLNNSLKAIDAGIGNHQRNVGNYANGFINVNQVLREVPNFAISATTGIQALSNNLPMMVDEIKRFVKEGNGFKETLAMIGKSIFSLGGAAVLVTTVLTALPKIMAAMASEADKAAQKMKPFAEVQQLAFKNTLKEKIELEALLRVARDKTKTDDQRSAAIRKINDTMPEYLGGITKENVDTQDTTDKVLGYISTLSKKALAQAYITKIQDAYVRMIDVENSSLSDNIKWYQQLWAVIKNGGNPAQMQIDMMVSGTVERLKNVTAIKAEIKTLEDKFKKDLDSGEAQLDLDKKLKEEKKKKAKEEKEYFDTKYKLIVDDLKRQNEYLKAIRDDEKYTFAVRAQAAKEFSINEQQILDAEVADRLAKNKFDLKNKKGAKNEEALINSEYRLNQAKEELDFLKVLESMQDKYAKDEVERTKKLAEDKEKAKEQAMSDAEAKLSDASLRIEEQMQKELRDLNFGFIQGEITSHEDYEKKKTAITQKYAIKRIEAEIKATEALLALADMDNNIRQKYATQLATLKNKLVELGVDVAINGTKKEEKADVTRIKKLESTLRDINRAVSTITSAINELGEAQFEQNKAKLESEKNAIEKNAALELERINNSTLSEQEKADQIIILEARKQAQIEENDRKNRKLEMERAKFQRLNSIASIISGTALAVVSALGDTTTPGPLRIILAAAIGALGAAQLAKAIATPVPKYKHGTSFHKGGLAVVGDGGKSERVILPSGEQFDTPSKSTLVDLPRGSKVLPDAEMVGRLMIKNMPRKVQAKTNTEDRELMVWQTRELTKAMAKNKPKVNTKVNVNLGRDIWLYKQVYE